MNETIEIFETYAIFKTGGKQYQAIPGKTLAVEKLEGEAGAKIEFKEVLFHKGTKGELKFGYPFIKDVAVKCSIIKQMRGPKTIAFKFQRRKKTRTKTGHRQSLTVIRIEGIE